MSQHLEYTDAKQYLQEANRRFFHPLGLALGLYPNGEMFLLDERDDPEGWFFLESEMSVDKARFIDAELERRRAVRESVCGSVVQPLPGETPEPTVEVLKAALLQIHEIFGGGICDEMTYGEIDKSNELYEIMLAVGLDPYPAPKED